MRFILLNHYLFCVAVLLLAVPKVAAQEPRERGRLDATEADRGREGGIPREQVLQQDGESEEGTEEGMPQFRRAPGERRVVPQWLPPERNQWKLGVYAYNTDTGVIITRVVPRSAARQAGLEPGDRIVTVDGFQVGWIQDHLYPLGAELQRQAGQRGRVTLLVQNVRNQRLLNLDVRLDRAR